MTNQQRCFTYSKLLKSYKTVRIILPKVAVLEGNSLYFYSFPGIIVSLPTIRLATVFVNTIEQDFFIPFF